MFKAIKENRNCFLQTDLNILCVFLMDFCLLFPGSLPLLQVLQSFSGSSSADSLLLTRSSRSCLFLSCKNCLCTSYFDHIQVSLHVLVGNARFFFLQTPTIFLNLFSLSFLQVSYLVKSLSLFLCSPHNITVNLGIPSSSRMPLCDFSNVSSSGQSVQLREPEIVSRDFSGNLTVSQYPAQEFRRI